LKNYQQKQSWKVFLAFFAFIIVVFSFWYLNTLSQKISAEESKRVRLWVETTRKKAALVKATNELFVKIKTEERKKVEIWAQATKRVLLTENDDDRNFYINVITSNKTIPVILTDNQNNINSWLNIENVAATSKASLTEKEKDILQKELLLMKKVQSPLKLPYYQNLYLLLYYKNSKIFYELKDLLDGLVKSFMNEVASNSISVPVILTDGSSKNILFYGNLDKNYTKPQMLELALQMDKENLPLSIDLGGDSKNLIHFKNSFIIQQLKWFPYIQMAIISLFLMVAYFLFSTSRKAEQNQVWLGLAKETAHQLGTPLSSLIGWTEILKDKGLNYEAEEIEKDILRLELITERFSKIGSEPILDSVSLNKTVNHVMDYMQVRTSKKIKFEINLSDNLTVKLNIPLFEWVIENLIKNAVDAMPEGEGKIIVSSSKERNKVYLDIEDTGKGIAKNLFNSIFDPGFTTKKRGWGLGLSLAKRIIEDYHKGKIFVKMSEPGKTIFRIVLNS
jgi:anti-sigma regulatory factor (Ser/Thr protein kinase)